MLLSLLCYFVTPLLIIKNILLSKLLQLLQKMSALTLDLCRTMRSLLSIILLQFMKLECFIAKLDSESLQLLGRRARTILLIPSTSKTTLHL